VLSKTEQAMVITFNVMARSRPKMTPLHEAASAGTFAIIQALLDAGADKKVKDKHGKTPWDLAKKNEKLKGAKGYGALNDAQHN
jgi:ankyrin repeat protein